MSSTRLSTAPAPGSWPEEAARRFPPEFDPLAYRQLNSAAERLGDEEARAHYRTTGRPGGWRANTLANREELVALIADAPSLLEIGAPGDRLLPVSERVVLAPADGDAGADGPLYDVVVSSHQIQSVPDLANHLKQVSASLKPGGYYVAMVPDKRYCLDHYQATSTIGAVLDAHRRGDAVSSWRAQVDGLTLTTHNDSMRHWLGDHGAVRDAFPDSLTMALRLAREPEAGDAGASGVDVYRTWFFTPASLRTIVWALRDLGLADLEPFRIYPTLRDRSEFWAVLRKPGTAAAQTPREDREDADEPGDESPVLPYDYWTPLRIPAALARRGGAVQQLADRETQPEFEERMSLIVRRQADDAVEDGDGGTGSLRLKFPPAPGGAAPSLTRPIPGMSRVLVSFCLRGASGILLGLYTPTPIQYFQPLALPAEIAEGYQKGHGITMDERFVYVALGGVAGQSLLALSREDLSFAGLHTLRRAADVHSILIRDGWLYVVSTGTDEVLRYPLEGGVPGDPERWWASPDGRRADLRHFNAIWPDGEGFLISAMDRRGLFSAGSSRPDADGIIMAIPSGEIIAQGLWYPHSVMRIGGNLAYVQSGGSTLNIHDEGVLRDLPGWPRGLCRIGNLVLVATSEISGMKLRNLPASAIRCSIVQCTLSPLQLRAGLDLSYWGRGIYDLFPLDTPHTGE